MDKIQIYFSDFFDVDKEIIESYGAVNISLINDLPLFVDPFLLFNSDKEEYQEIHNAIIKYLLFLQEQAVKYPIPTKPILNEWYHFPEVKQTWLGFSSDGNAGRGLGETFAKSLHKNLQTIFNGFGKETITRSSHLEKLCLICPLVGCDKISDFTTNFALKYLLEYTSEFAKKYLRPDQCRIFAIRNVEFCYKTKTWKSGQYYLPKYKNDYVLLTPRNILTRYDTFINWSDMIDSLEDIVPTVENATLRFALNQYLLEALPKTKTEMSKPDKNKAVSELISIYPELIDYYIRHKEEHEEQATSISEQLVEDTTQLFNVQLQKLANTLQRETDFYLFPADSYEAAYKRVCFLKNVIEDMDGYKLFYVNGKPVRREKDLQIMYRLIWYASVFDVNREVNNGRGSADFKVSYGAADTTIVEFKLASNAKLKQNLQNQVPIYQKASYSNRSIEVILYFSDAEYTRVNKILNELELQRNPNIILIDATPNKLSASNVG